MNQLIQKLTEENIPHSVIRTPFGPAVVLERFRVSQNRSKEFVVQTRGEVAEELSFPTESAMMAHLAPLVWDLPA